MPSTGAPSCRTLCWEAQQPHLEPAHIEVFGEMAGTRVGQEAESTAYAPEPASPILIQSASSPQISHAARGTTDSSLLGNMEAATAMDIPAECHHLKNMELRPECRRYLVITRTSTRLNACPLMRIVPKKKVCARPLVHRSGLCAAGVGMILLWSGGSLRVWRWERPLSGPSRSRSFLGRRQSHGRIWVEVSTAHVSGSSPGERKPTQAGGGRTRPQSPRSGGPCWPIPSAAAQVAQPPSGPLRRCW